MRTTALRTSEPAAWHAILARLPGTDIYFTPEYHALAEANGDGLAWAFVAEENDDILFYPCLTRLIEHIGNEPVPGGWQDSETVYGYSGPLATTTDEGFLARAWKAFRAWAHDERIVAAFLRFNPLSASERFADATCRVVRDRETVVIDLGGSAEELWQRFPPAQRRKVRRAEAAGLAGEEWGGRQGLGAFRSIYERTMHHLDAEPYYFFSDAYFEGIEHLLGDAAHLFAVCQGGRPIAAALFLLYRDRMHYHLGGSDSRARDARPNNLLFHQAAEWGRQRGFRWLHLGGGRTTEPGDGLFRFKASLSRARLPFHVGMCVLQPAVYDALCDLWRRQAGGPPTRPYHLLYRLGLTS